jgi:hypothetical protein
MLKESEFFFNFVFKDRFVLKFFLLCISNRDRERQKGEKLNTRRKNEICDHG